MASSSGSGIFKAENPEKFARAIVRATTHYEDYTLLAELSKGLGEFDEKDRYHYAPRLRTHAGKRLVSMTKKIGVLALRGAVTEHLQALNKLGIHRICRQAARQSGRLG